MAVPYKHKRLSVDLSYVEFKELKKVHEFLVDFYGDDNYFSFTRETM
jgi:hypothetical protein